MEQPMNMSTGIFFLHKKCTAGSFHVSCVADPWHFGKDPDTNADPRIPNSDSRIRMWIREARKHADPEHWHIYIILQRDKS
jgi:hypothetical protein